MTKILGIDPSVTCTGWASLYVADRHLLTGVVKGPPLSEGLHPDPALNGPMADILRLRGIAHTVAEFQHGHQLVVMESPAMAHANPGTAALYGVHYLIRNYISIPVLLVSPMSLKKFVIGRGVGKKDEMRLWAYKRWAIEADTNDEVDAACLAYFGAAYLDPTICSCDAQREAIAVVRAGPKVKAKRRAA